MERHHLGSWSKKIYRLGTHFYQVGHGSFPVVISGTRMGTFYGAWRSNAVMLGYKLPKSICVSGSPTTFTRKLGYRNCPMIFPQVGPIQPTQGTYIGRGSCPVVISGT